MNNNLIIYSLLLLASIVFVLLAFDRVEASDGYTSEPIVQELTVSFDQISKTELRSIYSGKLKYYDGVSLMIHYQGKYSLATQYFASEVLGSSIEKFYNDLTQWSSGGAAKKPRKVGSDFEMIIMVSQTPFSIGYASSGIIYQNLNDGLKILEVVE